MDWTRTSKIAGAGAAFALLIAWMVPPTTPKGPDPAPWRFAAAKRPDAPAETYAGAEIPTPSPIDRLAETPVRSLPVREQAAPRRETPRASAEPDDRSSAEVVTIDHRFAEADDAPDAGGYRAGYAWAANLQIRDPRDCRQWRGDSGEDGCLDFLREQDDRDKREGWAGQ